MTLTHLHLLVNHAPILGTFFALPLLLVALWRRTEVGTLLAAVLVLTIAAGGAVVAVKTGEPAEQTVEDLPGVSELLIHEHEERAEVATPITVLTALGGIGLLAWAWRRRAIPPVPTALLLAATAVSAGAMAWTGWAGGQIRHPEIRDPSIDHPVLESE